MDMSRRFNTYIDIPEVDFWRTFCMEQGVLRHFEKGEDFVTVGEVCRYVGFIKSGTLKYLAFSSDGCEHVVGMEFAGEFVADFPFLFYGTPSRVSITAQSPCDIYCVSVKVIAERMRNDRFCLTSSCIRQKRCFRLSTTDTWRCIPDRLMSVTATS